MKRAEHSAVSNNDTMAQKLRLPPPTLHEIYFILNRKPIEAKPSGQCRFLAGPSTLKECFGSQGSMGRSCFGTASSES